MDIEEIKKILRNSTAVLVLDKGEPSFVVLNYEMYKDLIIKNPELKNGVTSASGQAINNPEIDQTRNKPSVSSKEEIEILERINKDILALMSEIEKEEKLVSTEDSGDNKSDYEPGEPRVDL